METNNVLSEKQHGSVPNKNCMTNLLICMENWTYMLKNGHPIDIVYTNRVPHQWLLQKLKDFGIIGNTLNWVQTYLSGRRQRVRFDNEFSPWRSVKRGIPQGYVLGSTLFVLLINDMPDVCTSMCQLFPDDAKIFRSGCSTEDNEKLQEDLIKMTRVVYKMAIITKFLPAKLKIFPIAKFPPPKISYLKVPQIHTGSWGDITSWFEKTTSVFIH